MAYTTTILLPSPTFQLTFSLLQLVQFVELRLNDSAVGVASSVAGLVHQITYSSPIAANTQITIGFSIESPAGTGNYEVLDVVAKDQSNTIYQQTGAPLIISVGSPAFEVFVTSANGATGAISTYTVIFSPTITHIPLFYVQIEFPAEIDAINGQVGCSGDCQTVLDTSSLGIDIMRVSITSQQAVGQYSFSLTNIRNPR